MMKLKIKDKQDRDSVINALINAGYVVQLTEKKENLILMRISCRQVHRRPKPHRCHASKGE